MTAKIAVLGNCQAAVLSRCLELLSRKLQVDDFRAWELPRQFPTQELLIQRLSLYDFVFCQPGIVEDIKSLSRCLLYPNFQFSAFHPDVVYAGSVEEGPNYGQGVRSATGDYSSALVMFGYINGISAEGIARYFRGDVFERLGYFRLWNSSETDLFASCKEINFSVNDFFYDWARRGCFMHSFNHPKLFVIADIARQLLRSTDLGWTDVDCEQYMQDPGLEGEVTPVYPEIADRMGLKGDYLFKRPGNFFRSHASTLTMDLHEFISGCLESYSHFDRKFINCTRVNEWCVDPKVSAYLCEVAKG